MRDDFPGFCGASFVCLGFAFFAFFASLKSGGICVAAAGSGRIMPTDDEFVRCCGGRMIVGGLLRDGIFSGSCDAFFVGPSFAFFALRPLKIVGIVVAECGRCMRADNDCGGGFFVRCCDTGVVLPRSLGEIVGTEATAAVVGMTGSCGCVGCDDDGCDPCCCCCCCCLRSDL